MKEHDPSRAVFKEVFEDVCIPRARAAIPFFLYLSLGPVPAVQPQCHAGSS